MKVASIYIAAASLIGASASAQTTYVSESFTGSAPYGFYSTAYGGSAITAATDGGGTPINFDGAGGAALVSGFNGVELPAGTLDQVLAAATFDFSFYIGNSGETSSSSRVMFFSTGTSSNSGFGISFDVNQAADESFDVAINGRIGISQTSSNVLSETAIVLDFDTSVLVSGTVEIIDESTANLTISIGDQTLTFDQAANYGTLGNSMVVRANTSSWVLDGYRVEGPAAIPEPSVYAALAGLMALGFVAYRRRVR